MYTHIVQVSTVYMCTVFMFICHLSLCLDNFPSVYNRRMFENNDLKKLITSTRLNYWILFLGYYIVDC